jgi:hypothetical protein
VKLRIFYRDWKGGIIMVSSDIFFRMKMIRRAAAIGCLCLLFSCAATRNAIEDNKTLKLGLEAGGNWGGWVDHKELDGITGATSWKYHAGLHAHLNVLGRRFETGLEYAAFGQSVKYNDPAQSILGARDFSFHRLRVPLTYNLHVLHTQQALPLLVVKFGLSFGYTFSKSVTDQGTLPEYTFTNWDIGPAVGLASYPIRIHKNLILGMTCDFYRGSRMYEDAYHMDQPLGDISQAKLGIELLYSGL